MVGFPWDVGETPASWRREAPVFGQHSGEILSELGYTKEDIAHLKREGVIQLEVNLAPSDDLVELIPFLTRGDLLKTCAQLL
jgi:hypothetical protein